MNRPQVFYINLDRHPERRDFIEAELASLGWQGERIVACDGRKQEMPPMAAPFFARSAHLSPAQIACSVSHMLTWQQVVDRKIPAALILEDDARLAPDLGEVIEGALTHLPADWDIVRMCRPTKRSVKPLADLSPGRRLVRYSRIPLGRAGYLISHAGARKLLKPRHIIRPGDVEIAHPWLLDLNIYGVEAPPITQERVALPSSIGNQRGDISKYRRALPSMKRLAFNCRQLGPVWWTRCWLENVLMRHLRQEQ